MAAADLNPMRIVSDINGLERVAPPGVTVLTITAQTYPKRWIRNLLLLKAALNSDYLIINFSLQEVIFFAILLALVRCRLVTLDFFVVAPSPMLRLVIKWALGRIHTLLVYFCDSSRFEELYGISKERFVYVPFKVNSWEKVQVQETSDNGYIFVGGRSRRDFRTLFEAVMDLPYPVKILTAHEHDLRPHGSSLAGLKPPDNVELFYTDSDSRFFVELMARSRLVVLPIVKGAVIQAGIGVYLLGMALGKCVIISEALGVSDVLDNQAAIIPPGDAMVLRDTIRRLWENDEEREGYARRGKAYARALGGGDRLLTSVLNAIGVKIS